MICQIQLSSQVVAVPFMCQHAVDGSMNMMLIYVVNVPYSLCVTVLQQQNLLSVLMCLV